MPDPNLAHNTETPNPEPADPDELRPQRQCFEDIARAADAAVVHDVDLVAHGIDDVLQRVEAGDGAVDLASSVITNDETVNTELYRLPRIVHALDPLDAKGAPAGDALPRLHQPGDFLPAPGAAMPDVVDPERACLLGFFCGIDALFLQDTLEDGIGEADIRADATVEGIVPDRDIVVAPAELPSVGREDTGVETVFEGAGEEGDGEGIVMGHVELVETRAGGIGCGNGFDTCATGGREGVGEVQLLSDTSDGEFAGRMVDLVDPNRGESDRSGDLRKGLEEGCREGRGRCWEETFVAKDCSCTISSIGVDKLAWDNAMPEECLTWSL